MRPDRPEPWTHRTFWTPADASTPPDHRFKSGRPDCRGPLYERLLARPRQSDVGSPGRSLTQPTSRVVRLADRLGLRPDPPFRMPATALHTHRARALLLIVMVGAAVAVPAGALGGSGGRVECQGHRATLLGDSKNNKIDGTSDDDVIIAGGGNDTVHGHGGDDVICLGPGADDAWGDGGRDEIHGEDGYDEIRGGDGEDVLYTGKGTRVSRNCQPYFDVCFASGILKGNGGGAARHGWDGNGPEQGPIIDGGDGDDTGRGYVGGATFFGGSGDDVFWAGEAGSYAQGDGGKDHLNGKGGVDEFYGNDGDDELHGAGGDDALDGGHGRDTIFGGANEDTADGGSGRDSCTDVEHTTNC